MSTRVRPAFALALVGVILAALVGLTTLQLRHRVDARNLRAVQEVARSVSRPAGAVPSTECHGDGLVACWVVKQSPRAAADALAAGLTKQGFAAQTSCEMQSVPMSRHRSVHREYCTIVQRRGEHAAVILTGPDVRPNDVPAARSLIHVTAS